MVKTLPRNAEETGSIPGLGTKTPRAVGQLGLQLQLLGLRATKKDLQDATQISTQPINIFLFFKK